MAIDLLIMKRTSKRNLTIWPLHVGINSHLKQLCLLWEPLSPPPQYKKYPVSGLRARRLRLRVDICISFLLWNYVQLQPKLLDRFEFCRPAFSAIYFSHRGMDVFPICEASLDLVPTNHVYIYHEFHWLAKNISTFRTVHSVCLQYITI